MSIFVVQKLRMKITRFIMFLKVERIQINIK